MKRTVLACTLLAATAAPAMASTIYSTIDDMSGWIHPFGEPDTATYGQTFTVGADASLVRFTIFMREIVANQHVHFDVRVMEWTGTRATGDTLFQSVPLGTTNIYGPNTIERFDVDMGGLVLNPGQQYVVFVSASEYFDGNPAGVDVPIAPDSAYTGGSMFFLNNGSDLSRLTTEDWTPASLDLAFELAFVPTPIPLPTPGLLSAAGLALLGSRRRRSMA